MSIWGRVIGGAAGFALGGPIGAILGVMAGGAFDRRSKSKSSFNFNRINNNQKQQIFTLSFIILAAKLAKSDGIVSDDEIRAFKEKFKVPKSEIPKVGKIFNEAKKDTYGYKQIANQVGDLFSANKILLEELLNNLFYIAASDGKVSISEIDLLRQQLSSCWIAPAGAVIEKGMNVKISAKIKQMRALFCEVPNQIMILGEKSPPNQIKS